MSLYGFSIASPCTISTAFLYVFQLLNPGCCHLFLYLGLDFSLCVYPAFFCGYTICEVTQHFIYPVFTMGVW